MIRVIAFKRGHLDLMGEPKEGFEDDAVESTERGCRRPETVAVTLVHNKEVLGVVGVNHLHAGVADVFGVYSDAINRVPIAFTRMLQRLVDIVMYKEKIKRLQYYVKADYQKGQRFATTLGFTEEAILKKYINGEDHKLLVRFK